MSVGCQKVLNDSTKQFIYLISIYLSCLLVHNFVCCICSVQLWHITVVVVVAWTPHVDMLEFQHPAPQVVRPQRPAAVHIEVILSCVILPLALVTTIQLVTCHPISEGLIQDFTDTEKVCM